MNLQEFLAVWIGNGKITWDILDNSAKRKVKGFIQHNRKEVDAYSGSIS